MPQATAQVSRRIHAAPDAVWDALTDPAKLKRYFFGADVESDWRPGSPIRFRGEHEGKPYEDKGEIRSFEPGRRLAFSHWSALSGAPDTPENYHLVTFELQPQGAETEVVLTQSNLQGGPTAADEKMRGQYEKNWAMVLEGLDRTLAQ